MEIRDLKAFMSVVESGSYTKAAQKIFVSQPSLSKSIKKLEDALDVSLLDRSTRHVVLTDAGKIVYDQGKKILYTMSETKLLLEDLQNVQTGHLKIGMPPLVGRMFFPTIARKFRTAYPAIELELVERGAKLVGTMVENSEVDVGFVVLPSDLSKFHVQPFIEDVFCLYIHENHPLAKQSALSLKQLEHESFILFTEEFSLHDLIIKTCKQAGFQPKVSFKSSQWDLMMELVASQLGVTLLPQSIFHKQAHPNIKLVPLKDAELLWRIGVITKKGAYQSYALKSFLQLLQ